MEALVDTIVFGVVVPALVAASLMTVFHVLGRRLGLKNRNGLGMALGLGLGNLAGDAGVFWPSWPPLDVTDRIPFLAIAALVLALVEVSRPVGTWMAWGNRIVLTGLTLVAILGPAFGATWQTPTILLGGALLAAGMVLSWASLDALAARLSGAAQFLPLLVITTGASVALVLSGNMVLGRLCGVLTAALAGCWVVAWRVPSLSLERGATPTIAVVLASLLLVGRFYGELTTPCALLLASAPAFLWLARFGRVQRCGPWLRTFVATSAVLVPVAIAVGLAVAAMPSYEY